MKGISKLEYMWMPRHLIKNKKFNCLGIPFQLKKLIYSNKKKRPEENVLSRWKQKDKKLKGKKGNELNKKRYQPPFKRKDKNVNVKLKNSKKEFVELLINITKKREQMLKEKIEIMANPKGTKRRMKDFGKKKLLAS